jgi:hypothetical protein
LIETMIALLILIIGLLGVAQLFIISTYSNTYAQNTTLSVKASEAIMEQLRSITDWTDPRIQPGGTVRMASDGGPTINSDADAGADYVAGIYFEPVMDGVRQRNLDMRLIYPDDAVNWGKRRFEVRWQVIGHNSTGTVEPSIVLTNAYDPNPSFSTLSAPTGPRPDGQQNSVYVIIRVAPIADNVRTAKRIQFATILSNPD